MNISIFGKFASTPIDGRRNRSIQIRNTMNKYFSIIFLLFAAPFAAAQSLDWKPDYASAMQAAKDGNQCILVFVNGSDWSAPSRQYKEKVVDSSRFAQGLGNRFVLFESDNLDWPTPEQKEELNKKRKGFDVTVRHYPGVVILDSENRRLRVLEAPKGGTDELLKAVEETLELKARRDAELEKASKVEGLEKAKHLSGALEILGKNSIHGGNSYRPLFNELKKFDPEDTTGTVRRFDFNVDAFSERSLWPLMREKKYDEAMELVEKEFADPRNDMELKQRFTAQKFYIYQQQEDKLDKAVETLRELIALDDSTYMAELARGYIKNITEPIILEEAAWDGRKLRFFYAVWHLDAAELVSEPGKYQIHFERTKHEGISVRDVAFAVDDKESVKVDMPRGDKVELEIPAFSTDAKREFRFSVKGNGWFGSQGRIHVKKI